MLITRQQIQTLSSYSGNLFPVTSCYLNIDRKQYPQKTYITALKDLIKQSQSNITSILISITAIARSVTRKWIRSRILSKEKAVKLAVKQNCEIEYVVNHPIMPELGNIGAVLRFK